MADWTRHIELGQIMDAGVQLTPEEKAEAVAIFPEIIAHIGRLFVSISDFEAAAGVEIESWVEGEADYDGWHDALRYYCAEGSRWNRQMYSQIFDSRFPPNAPLQAYDYQLQSQSALLIWESAIAVKGFYGAEEDSPFGRPQMQADKSQEASGERIDIDPETGQEIHTGIGVDQFGEEIIMVPWDGGESDVLIDQPLPPTDYEIDPETGAPPWESE